jgi:hypothetical protein
MSNPVKYEYRKALIRKDFWLHGIASEPRVGGSNPSGCIGKIFMAQPIVITLEKPLPDAQAAYVKASSGKALGRELEKLDFASRCRNIPAITSLLSESHAVLIKQLTDQGFDPAKMRLPAEQWFSAADGLAIVRALAEYVNAKLNDFKQPNPILRDLKAAEALLAAAQAAGVRFHFTKV